MEKSLNKIKPQERAPSMVMKKNLSRAPAREWYKRWWGILLIIIGLYFLVSLVIFAIMGEKLTSLNQEGDISLVGREQVSKEQLYLHTDDDPNWGTPEAPLQIIEFSDFQCSFCQETFPIIRELLFRYQDQIYYLYRDFPDFLNHPQAQKAAEAANCALEQDKFWPMHDKLFINQDNLTVDDLRSYAQEIGLNQAEFEACLDSGKYLKEIQEDYQDGVALGVIGTPTFFINGYRIGGSLPRELFLKIAEIALFSNTD